MVEKTFSSYGYCNLNPVNMVDTDGRIPSPWRILKDTFRDFIETTNRYFHITASKNGLSKVTSSNYTTRMGRIFEDTVIRSLGENKNTQGFRPNKTSTKKVIPDLVGNGGKHFFSTSGNPKDDIVFSFPNATFVDAKFTSNVNFSPSYNPGQIKGFIDVLSNMKGSYANGKWNPNIKASEYGAATLVFITPEGTTLDSNIIEYAASKNVNLYQRTVQQDVLEPSNVRVAPNMSILNQALDYRGEENIPSPLKASGQSVKVNWDKL
ncbi:hypothetical protein [Flavobacterium branchiophilum]